MSTIILDTDYLRELAGEFGTAVELVGEAINTLKGAMRGSILLSLTSQGKSINNGLANEINELTKLSGGLEEIKKVLLDEANQLESCITTNEPKLSQLTDEIRIANGFVPNSNGGSSGSGSGQSPTPAPIPVTPVPDNNEPTPNIIIPEQISDVVNKVIDFFKNLFSFWK